MITRHDPGCRRPERRRWSARHERGPSCLAGRADIERPGPGGANSRLPLAAVILGILLLPSSCSPAASDARQAPADTPVILITLDTTRRDRLGCYGYTKGHTPNLDRIAREAVRFDNAYTSAPITLPSHCSMHTGNYPFVHGVRDNGVNALDPANVTLAERLQPLGYHRAAFVSALVLGKMFGLDQGFEVYDDQLHSGFIPAGNIPDRSARRTTDAALRWLAARPAGPFFLWLHYFDPHMPYDEHPDLRPQVADDYDAEIAAMDRAIGRVIAALEQEGLWEKSLVIVCADHGEGLGDNGEDTHGFFLYDSTTRIPFLIKGPGLPAGVVNTSLARTIDILPTVLDALGQRPDPPVQGASLLGVIREADDGPTSAYMETYLPHFSFGWSWLEALRMAKPRLKYIDSPRAELYDLDDDPGETHNLVTTASETCRKAAGLIADLKANVPAGVVRVAGGKLEGQVDRSALAQMGYLSDTAEILPDRGPDIKDVYQYKKRRDEAMELSRQGKLAEAIEGFREFAKHTPRAERANEYLGISLVGHGRLLAQQGRSAEAQPMFTEAIERLEKAAAGERVRFQVVYHLAVAYYYRQKASREQYEQDMQTYERLLERTLEIHPEFGPARYFLGQLFSQQQRWKEVEAILRPLVESWQPSDAAGDPRSVEIGGRAAVLLGNALFAQKRLVEARAMYERAPEMAPGYIDYLYYLGQLDRQEGHLAEARAKLETFLQRAATSPAVETRNLIPRVRKMLGEM